MRRTVAIDEVFTVISAVSAGDMTARIALPDDPQLDDLATKIAFEVNSLLDSLHFRAAELERQVAEHAEQLRKSEETFSKAFQLSPAAISIATLPDGRWLEVNEALLKMTGYNREEVIGRTSVELGLVDAAAREKILEAIRTQGMVRNVEIQMHTKSGELVDVLVSVEQVELGGQACGLTIQHDITEIKRSEREIRRLNDDLERRQIALETANHELEAFTYSVSHDLRAPLRSIDGLSKIVIEDYGAILPAQGLEDLERVRANAQEMAQLIDALLRFSRISRQTLEKRTISIQEIVRQVLNDLQDDLNEREIEISMGELPECQADPALLRQVVTNLLSNAIKYTRPRKIAHIKIGSYEQEGQCVYFVRDDGVGFDMRYADKLFGVFQRLHRAEEFEGIGAGLAITQRIIQRHGGRIWAESETDRQTTFYFTLG